MVIKFRKIIVGVSVGVAIFVLFGDVLGMIGKRQIRSAKARLHSDIQTSIPRGASPTDVISFVDSRHMSHSQLISAGTDKIVREVLGAPSVIQASSPISSLSLYSYSLRVIFKFDENQKLTSYDEKVEGDFF